MSQRAEPQIDINNPKKPKIIKLQLDTRECCRDKAMYATSFIRQWYLLMQRMILCLIRDRSLAPTRIFIHIAVASMVGTLFYNIGNDASMIANNFNYVFMSIMFTMFTAFSTMLVICKYRVTQLKLIVVCGYATKYINLQIIKLQCNRYRWLFCCCFCSIFFPFYFIFCTCVLKRLSIQLKSFL